MLIKESGIYKILNIITYDFYVGSAVYVAGRWRQHCRELCKNIHRNTDLQRDWNKYGEQAFEFSTLELCEKEILLEREQFYFDLLKPTYNVCPIAGNRLGVKHSDETRAIMSEVAKKRPPISELTRTNMSNAKKGELHWNFGKHHTEATRAKISESHKGELNPNFGKHPTAESRANMSGENNHNFGKHFSAEHRAKISEAQKGELGNNFGKHPSDDARANMSEAQKNRWALKREAQTT